MFVDHNRMLATKNQTGWNRPFKYQESKQKVTSKLLLLVLFLSTILIGSGTATAWTGSYPVYACSVGQLAVFSGITRDINGLKVISANWLDTDCGMCNGADISGDSDVDIEDFALFARKWLGQQDLTLVINEFMASNSDSSNISDPQGEHDDWIEIHNYGDEVIDLSGMRLSDGNSQWQIPAGLHIGPGG